MTKEERKTYVKQFYIPIVYGKLDKLVDEIYEDVKELIEDAKAQGFREAIKEMGKVKGL